MGSNSDRIRFGVNLSTSAAPDASPLEHARHAESLGFDLLSASDHPIGTRPTFETWSLLVAAATVTTRIGILSNVLGVPNRPPALVAKMAESLDRLSGGRLTLGIGGGASNEAARALGVPARAPREKIEALDEAITIIRGLWAESGTSFAGEHYGVLGATIEPKPARRIPIWIGAYGRRALTVVGRRADGWVPSMPYAPEEQVLAMRKHVRDAAADAGRDPDEIVCAYNVPVKVEEGARRSEKRLAGSPDEIADRLIALAREGFRAFVFWPYQDQPEQRERLAHEVMPRVRDTVGGEEDP